MSIGRAVGIFLCVAGAVPVSAQMSMPMPAAKMPDIPAMIADKSNAKAPPAPIETNMRGYGTRGVNGRTLSDMKASCAISAGLDAVHAARCDQLRRTLQTSPGNTR